MTASLDKHWGSWKMSIFLFGFYRKFFIIHSLCMRSHVGFVTSCRPKNQRTTFCIKNWNYENYWFQYCQILYRISSFPIRTRGKFVEIFFFIGSVFDVRKTSISKLAFEFPNQMRYIQRHLLGIDTIRVLPLSFDSDVYNILLKHIFEMQFPRSLCRKPIICFYSALFVDYRILILPN